MKILTDRWWECETEQSLCNSLVVFIKANPIYIMIQIVHSYEYSQQKCVLIANYNQDYA